MPEQDEAAETVVVVADTHEGEAVLHFEDAWRRGPPPSIDDYLTATTPDRRSVLVELVHTDLEYRLKAGLPCRAEDYLNRYPELAPEPDVALDLIAAEYALRRRLESGVGIEEYRLRFPEYRDEMPARLERAEAASGLPRIAGYTVLGIIGRGGMNVVYKARDEELRRLVALKMIVAGRHASPEGLARFRAEAEAVARLQHPNIVQVFEVGEADGPPGSSCPYIALEYADGGSLDRLLAGKPQPPRQGAALVETLAHAVQAAHDRGIIHRDLKPANVLWVGAGELGHSGADPLDEPGLPKIADFGLAKLLDGESATTQVGQVLGTPSYMAPEQAEGRNDAVGRATDVYALGAILYELLTGRPPFLGLTALETLEQVKSLEPLPPSQLQPKTPRDLETICLKCLHKAPAGRYAKASDLADDLRRYRLNEPILARPTGHLEQAWRRCRRHPREAGIAVMLLGLLALMGFSLAQAGRVRADRAAETTREVNTELDRASTLRGRAQAAPTEAKVVLGEARAAVRRAEVLLAHIEVKADLRRRARQLHLDLEAEDRDRSVIDRLDEILVQQMMIAELPFDYYSSSAASYSDVFRGYGIDVETLAPATAAARLRTSPIAESLVGALDGWSHARLAMDADDWKMPAEVALLADSNPGRNRLRAALVAGDIARLKALLTDADPSPLSASTARFLAFALRLAGSHADALALLKRAHRAHPDDFCINQDLGQDFTERQAPLWSEAARYFTAATAIRRQNPSAHFNLGKALMAQNVVDEAIESFQEAIRLKPDFFDAYFNLGYARYVNGDLPGAVSDYRQTLLLKPDFALGYIYLGMVLQAQGRFTEALAALRRGHELGSRRPDWDRLQSAGWVRECERQVIASTNVPEGR